MALWSIKTVQVPGFASLYASSGPITVENRRHYILDTTADGITVNLPTGIDGFSIRITDAKGTFGTNNVTVIPAIGQKINNLATNESLLLDANEMWIEFTWNAIAGFWVINAPGILGLLSSSYTDYPHIISPSAPSSSTLRLYAKSDNKLYTKDPAGNEKKVGGGLDHPTTGSTFEVDSYSLLMTGTSNTGVGVQAGSLITSGNENTVLGYAAGLNITSGTSNTLIGSGSGRLISTTGSNVAIGRNTFYSYAAVAASIAIGSGAGFYAQGANHILIGELADSYTDAASYNNIAIGKNAGIKVSSTGVSGTVCIGTDSSSNAATATISNQFVLGTINHLYRFPGIVQTSLVLGPIGTSAGQTGILQLRELAANGTNSIALKAPDAVTSDVIFTLPDSAGTNGQLLTTNGSGVLSWITVSANSTINLITQASHGFTSVDVGRPLYLNGSTYAFARSDLEATAEVAGLIASIVDTNSFYILLSGEVSSVGANLIEGGGSLTPGEVYFLSAITAGKLTLNPPTIVGQISKPVGIARTASAFNFYNMRGSAVGGSNVYSQINLTNNSITTVQDVSAYTAGSLSGWVYIDGATDYRFYISVQFSKLGFGTSWDKSYDTVGDTPPSGFSLDITSAGLIQITFPSISGFVSSNITFGLNVPLVGATLPLTVNSSNVVANYRAITSAYTITSNDYYVSATGASGYTVTLPPAASVSGKMYVIKSRLNAGQILTIDGDASETIDGQLIATLYQNASLHILSNGTSWEIF